MRPFLFKSRVPRGPFKAGLNLALLGLFLFADLLLPPLHLCHELAQQGQAEARAGLAFSPDPAAGRPVHNPDTCPICQNIVQAHQILVALATPFLAPRLERGQEHSACPAFLLASFHPLHSLRGPPQSL